MSFRRLSRRSSTAAAVLAALFLLAGLAAPGAAFADGTTPPNSTGSTSLSGFPSNYPCDGEMSTDPIGSFGVDDWECQLPVASAIPADPPATFNAATVIGQLYYPNGTPAEVPIGGDPYNATPVWVQYVSRQPDSQPDPINIRLGVFNNWFGFNGDVTLLQTLDTGIAPSEVGLAWNGSGYTFVGFPNNQIEFGTLPSDSPFASLINVVPPSSASTDPSSMQHGFLSSPYDVGAGGQQLDDVGNLYVPGPPVPVGACTPDFSSAPGTYDCTSNGTNDYRTLAYKWHFPDGTTQNGANVVYHSSAAGLGLSGVTLTATAGDGWAGTINVASVGYAGCMQAQNDTITPNTPNTGQATTIATTVVNNCNAPATFTSTVSGSAGQFLGLPASLTSGFQSLSDYGYPGTDFDNTVTFSTAGDNQFSVGLTGTIGAGAWPFTTNDGGDDITVNASPMTISSVGQANPYGDPDISFFGGDSVTVSGTGFSGVNSLTLSVVGDPSDVLETLSPSDFQVSSDGTSITFTMPDLEDVESGAPPDGMQSLDVNLSAPDGNGGTVTSPVGAGDQLLAYFPYISQVKVFDADDMPVTDGAILGGDYLQLTGYELDDVTQLDFYVDGSLAGSTAVDGDHATSVSDTEIDIPVSPDLADPDDIEGGPNTVTIVGDPTDPTSGISYSADSSYGASYTAELPSFTDVGAACGTEEPVTYTCDEVSIDGGEQGQITGLDLQGLEGQTEYVEFTDSTGQTATSSLTDVQSNDDGTETADFTIPNVSSEFGADATDGSVATNVSLLIDDNGTELVGNGLGSMTFDVNDISGVSADCPAGTTGGEDGCSYGSIYGGYPITVTGTSLCGTTAVDFQTADGTDASADVDPDDIAGDCDSLTVDAPDMSSYLPSGPGGVVSTTVGLVDSSGNDSVSSSDFEFDAPLVSGVTATCPADQAAANPDGCSYDDLVGGYTVTVHGVELYGATQVVLKDADGNTVSAPIQSGDIAADGNSLTFTMPSLTSLRADLSSETDTLPLTATISGTTSDSVAYTTVPSEADADQFTADTPIINSTTAACPSDLVSDNPDGCGFGPIAGGYTVTVNGSDFDDATSVLIDAGQGISDTATPTVGADGNSLTFTMPTTLATAAENAAQGATSVPVTITVTVPVAGGGGSTTTSVPGAAQAGAPPDNVFDLALPLQVTSESSADFTTGTADSFKIETTGGEGTTIALSSITGAGTSLPSGLSFTDNGDGTATIAGTADSGAAGLYTVNFTADDHSDPVLAGTLTLIVASPPTFTSANSAGFTLGSSGEFTIVASGDPIPAISEQGTLPNGLTFTDNGNGTATISGTPDVDDAPSTVIDLTATNGATPSGTQSLTITTTTLTAPGTPTAVTAAAGVDSADVSWSAPSGDPTPTGYVVTATPSPAVAIPQVAAGADTTTVTGLTPGVSYSFTLTALNGTVQGSASTPSNPILPTASPESSSGSGSSGSPGGTATTLTIASTGGPTITAQGSGEGTVNIATYGTPPVTPVTGPSPSYFDLATSPGSSFTSVTAEFCVATAATTIEWWNPTAQDWEPVSDVSGPDGNPACDTITIDATSTPSLSELTGTVLAVVHPGTAPSTTPSTTPATTSTTTPPVATAATTPDIAVESSALVRSAKALLAPVVLTCTAASCSGSVQLTAGVTAKVAEKVKRRGKTVTKIVTKTRTVVLASDSYELAAGESGSFELTPTTTGRSLLAKVTRRSPLNAKITATVQGGASASRGVSVT